MRVPLVDRHVYFFGCDGWHALSKEAKGVAAAGRTPFEDSEVVNFCQKRLLQLNARPRPC